MGARAGHTWYNIRCKLSGVRNTNGHLEWVSPRRLVQLRQHLHHRVKEVLAASYDDHFQNTRFAKTGGPPGTTARLRAWFETLAHCINNGIAPPSVATHTFAFLLTPSYSQHLLAATPQQGPSSAD